MVVIEARNLRKVYGRSVALHGLSFKVNAERVIVLGPNGSGKSTLLSIVCGLRKPTSGSMYVEGIKPYEERSKAVELFSCMFEKPRFPVGVRVKHVVELVRGCSFDEIFLKDFGLAARLESKLYSLSMGEAQMLGLYVALCRLENGARLLVLDEPFSHLDVFHAGVLWSLLAEFRNIVVSTHVIDEAEALDGYVLILDSGRLVWKGRIDDILACDSFEVIYRLSRRAEVEKHLRSIGARIIAWLGDRVLVENVDVNDLMRLMRSGVVLGVKVLGVRRYYVETR